MLIIIISVESASYIYMEYLLQFHEMNYWVGVGKYWHTYEATNMTKICSADAGISAQTNVLSRRCPGVISIDL